MAKQTTAPKGTCAECGKPVAFNERAAYKVEGYETERERGGQNHVRERRRVDGLIWHARSSYDCIDRHIRTENGVGEQSALL